MVTSAASPSAGRTTPIDFRLGAGPPPQQDARRHKFHRRDDRFAAYVFVLPFTVLFAMFLIAPILYAFETSFFTSTLIGGTHFSGFANYTAAFQDSQFWAAMARVLIYGVIETALAMLLATVFAVILDMRLVPLVGAIRVILFLPYAVPGAIAVVVWGFLLEPQVGSASQVLSGVGLGHVNFLQSGPVDLISIGAIALWAGTGYTMLIIYTGLRSVPPEHVESAIVDGAGTWRIALSIKLAQVRGLIAGMFLLGAIGAVQLYTEPTILSSLTTSIPSHFTPLMAINAANTDENNPQYAAALSILLGGISLVTAGTMTAMGLRRSKLGRGARK
jgi:multiple sugar transport system permease protein